MFGIDVINIKMLLYTLSLFDISEVGKGYMSIAAVILVLLHPCRPSAAETAVLLVRCASYGKMKNTYFSAVGCHVI